MKTVLGDVGRLTLGESQVVTGGDYLTLVRSGGGATQQTRQPRALATGSRPVVGDRPERPAPGTQYQ